MDINLQRLKKLAEKATPGPWGSSKSGEVCYMGNYGYPSDICVSKNRDNCKYITAFCPNVVLELIEQLESLQGIIIAAFQALGGNCTSTDVPADLPKRIRELVSRHNGLLCEKGDLSQEAHWLADLLVDLKICPTVKIYKCLYQEDKDYPHSECVKCWREAARKAVGVPK